MEIARFDSLNQTLDNISNSLGWFLPELILSFGFIIIIVIGLLFKSEKSDLFSFLAIASLLAAFGVLFWKFSLHDLSEQTLFLGMVVQDSISRFLKVVFLIGGVFSVIMTFKNISKFRSSSEYAAIFLILVLGTLLMVSSTNLLMIYLSIELVSISSYILIAFGAGKKSKEAALKYLLFGAISSAIMLYGMSWIYGFSGTLDLNHPNFYSGLLQQPILPLAVALFMVTAGFLFKVSAAPFHIWAPDVYEAAPTPLLAYLSVAPKVGGVIIMYRFVSGLDLNISLDWRLWIAAIAALTMLIGNFSALWQTKAKRMLAYSSIAHGGFLLATLIVPSTLGLNSLLFYAAIYLFMNVGAFFFVQLLERNIGSNEMSLYKGWGTANPALAVYITIVMIALAGLPPTAGFSAKFLVFSGIWESYTEFNNPYILYLLIFGIFNTVVSLFYYLKIPYLMIFKESREDLPKSRFGPAVKAFGLILTLPIIILFFKIDWLIDFINSL